ncbi:PiggyBac transposable element-derived protein 3 [Trichinella papuae]|uniref:PiggyBac transposable element-derived protein 3 n=1 Tax=Trichinella papuae TaxID=268474 RepID=A0A0V1N318_9BILA|nr:PiggyBac transposable element-derived protein 3 [Trichinella papuae]
MVPAVEANQNLPAGDKMSKISPLYQMLNDRLVQYGIFHELLSIDESMVPYYGRHSAKMFIRGKPIRVGYKVWMFGGMNGYPYHLNIYQGKEPGAERAPLSERVRMVDVIASHSCGHDNAVVTVASIWKTHSPLHTVKQRVACQRNGVKQPYLIQAYKGGMGGVDLLDRLLAVYRPTVRGKKWYWPLFANAINVATVAAWRIHCEVEQRALSHLEFRRQVTMCLLRAEMPEQEFRQQRTPTCRMSHLPDIRFDGIIHTLSKD